MNIPGLVEQAHRIAVEHGFWEGSELEKWRDPSYADAQELAVKLALIHSKISKALEALRDDSQAIEWRIDPFAEELADVVIRVADLCGALEIDLDAAITAKMAVNEHRLQKHGKAF